MEYSKEDLMEAKRQILGVGENMGTEESKKIWEKNAQFWDNAMGDKSNEYEKRSRKRKVKRTVCGGCKYAKGCGVRGICRDCDRKRGNQY